MRLWTRKSALNFASHRDPDDIRTSVFGYGLLIRTGFALAKKSPFRQICNVLYHHYVLSMLLALFAV